TIGNDGENLVVARVSPSGNAYVRRFNPATGADLHSAMQLQNFSDAWGRDLTGVYWGPGDFAEDRIAVMSQGGAVLTFTTTGVRVSEAWYNANQENADGLAWDGERFWAMSSNGRLNGFSRITNPGGADNNDWWVAHTWRDADGHETEMGPPTRFTQYRRASLIVRTPPIPDGADRVGVYIGRGNTEPAREDFHRVDMDVPGETALRIDEVDYEGENPPEDNTFPDSTPGEIRSQRGGLEIRGDGTVAAPRKMQAGFVDIPAGTPGSAAVEFDQPFPAPPIVTMTAISSLATPTFTGELGVEDVTTTGFTANIRRSGSTDTRCNWIAVLPDNYEE